MSKELSEKIQHTLWWIASIATSVLCCSALFVLFASYLVDVKIGIKENNERISVVEDREDKILTEIGLIRKHAVFQTAQPAVATQPPAVVPEPSTGIGVEGIGADKAAGSTDAQPLAITPTVGQQAPVPTTVTAPANSQPASVMAPVAMPTVPTATPSTTVVAPVPSKVPAADGAPSISVPVLTAQPEKK
jgi:hypothetical protein